MASVCYNAWYMKEAQRLYHERIVTDPRILAGKPVVKGTRIAVDLGVLSTSNRKPPLRSVSPATGVRPSTHSAVFPA